MSQLATSMSAIINEPGRLPSQTIQNPKENVSMVQMSNLEEALEEAGRPSLAIERLKGAQAASSLVKQRQGPTTYKPTVKHFTHRHRPDWNQEEDRPNDGRTWVTHADNGRYAFTVSMTPPPITHFNVPASGWDIGTKDSSSPMKAIASKDHATQKNKVENKWEPKNEQNGLGTDKPLTRSRDVLLEMSKDPGAFTVTCGIGKAQVHHCLIDLGAAVNVLPYPLYCSLGLGPLKPPKISLELRDKSSVRPVGVLEKLMLRVGELDVPADFYVIPIGDNSKDDPPTIILGRPFLYTTREKIDIGKGSLSLAFNDRITNFHTRKPPDIVNTSKLSTLIPDLPRKTESMKRPAAMVKGPSPSQRYWKEKPPEQWEQDPSTSSHKNSGRVKAMIDAGAAAKFALSRLWDPDPS
ncbi:unnamed protein product [Rhodiola kirilowii]